MDYPIPQSAVRALQAYHGRAPQNPGLLFERFAPDWSRRSTLKKEGMEVVRQAADRVDKALLAAWNARWEAAMHAAGVELFALKTDWRFVAGLGRKGPLEVGFTFHRYGFPILPGSSVKGVARAWGLMTVAEALGVDQLRTLDEILSEDKPENYEQKWQEKCGPKPEVKMQADRFRKVFGTTGIAGSAIFFDAIPAELPKLELDIMNPHFPNYYQDSTGRVAPTDWQSPVPIYFLTVAPNVEFRFAVGWRGPIDDKAQALRELAKEWLVKGLTELGAGAKTSAGYGYFIVEASEVVAKTKASKAIAAEPALLVPEASLTWHTGTVRHYRPDKGYGRLVDDETGEELSFRQKAIEEKGWSPGKKQRVYYATIEEEGQQIVMKIRRA